MKYSALAFLALGLISQAALAINTGERLKVKLDAAMDSAIAEKRIVGSVVIVLHKGEVVYERAAGMADREAGKVMATDSIFRLSSLSKAIVSTAALALVDKGVIKLDDPVTKYIPDFRPKLPGGYEPVITLRHLLTHTSGLAYNFLEPVNGPYHTAGVSDGTDVVNMSLEENLQRLSSVPLIFPPGVAWLYSLDTDVMGEVIARATGKTLPEAVAELVTRPLGMNDTNFVVNNTSKLTAVYVNGNPAPVRMSERQVVPFAASAIVFSPDRATDQSAYASGGSGMMGSATDFVKLLEEIRLSKGQVVSRESVRGMTTVQTGDLDVVMAPGCGWSLAFAVVKDPTRTGSLVKKGTFQWSGAYGHNFWVDVESELTVVVLTNTGLEGLLGQYPADIQKAIYLE